ncbi:hypothetical protein F5Y12DRAFT_711579 [Xylaria sp. FL1777]|nr:hypothetical protein F5Y12DRAFT_711579 [Xylaria sp. FL1777]
MANSGQAISAGGLLALLWTFTGVTTLLFGGRLLIRGGILKGFHLDDLFSSLAWLFLLVSVISSTIQNDTNYHYSAILVGEAPMLSPTAMADLAVSLKKWNVIVTSLFWTSLFCVKLSFMFLYRAALRYGATAKQNVIWSAALIYILISYGICLIGVFGQCGDVRNLFNSEQCSTPYVASLLSKLLWVSYFFNVSSDFVVILLPMPVIWRLNMRKTQKVAVTVLCGLTLVTIVFETVRSVKLYMQNQALILVYSYLELLISVFISLLPFYRFLLSQSEKDREYRRLLWSRVTMSKYRSSSSNSSLPSYSRRPQQSHGADSSQGLPEDHQKTSSDLKLDLLKVPTEKMGA